MQFVHDPETTPQWRRYWKNWFVLLRPQAR